MKKYLKNSIAVLSCLIYVSQQTVDAQPVGQWTFNNSTNLSISQIGNNLQFIKSDIFPVPGPAENNKAIKIGRGSHLVVKHGINPKENNTVNEYTLLIDFKVAQDHKYVNFFQTDPENTSDGELFVNPEGSIGISRMGYSIPLVTPGKWYRLIFALKKYSCNIYLNGTRIIQSPVTKSMNFGLTSDALLLFADNNGEDDKIEVAEVQLFDKALTSEEVKSYRQFGELKTDKTILTPYLQSPTPHSMSLSWYQLFKSDKAYIEYGTTEDVPLKKDATLQFVDSFPYYYSVPIYNLKPETTYYYRIKSDLTTSTLYHFRTPPSEGDISKDGHIRFVVYGDSRSYPKRHTAIINAMKKNLEKIYGNPIENYIDTIINVGDIVGDGRKFHQYHKAYFSCISSLASYVPFMVVIGNHEREANFYYSHMQYENFAGTEGEKYYSFALGRVMFIVMNTDVMGEKQFEWVKSELQKAQNNNKIDWIMCTSHYPVYSESWFHHYSYRAWLTERICPLLRKYPKVAMLFYGHTHAYERGADKDAQIFFLMNGGGGASLENWAKSQKKGLVKDYPEIVKSISEFGYSVVDIDIEKQCMDVVSYGYGNDSMPGDVRIIDTFHLNNTDISRPDKPVILSIQKDENGHITVTSSPYEDYKDLMYSEFQVSKKKGDFAQPSIDILRSRENIYDVDSAGNPIDHHIDIDISKLTIDKDTLSVGTYWTRVRYRNNNLLWSSWSDEYQIIQSN